MKLITIKIILAFVCVGVVGCEKSLLDPGKDNQQTIDRLLRDPAYAEGLLHSAYKHLPTDYSFSEVATDDAVSNDKSNSYMLMATGQWSTGFSPVSEWDAYAAIFNLNYLLSIAEDVEWSWQSPSRNKLFINKNTGEAYALRGYFYLRLLIAHGGLGSDGSLLGVPIVTKPFGVNDAYELPRASYQEVVDQINSDFEKALGLLPYTWNSEYSSDDSLRTMGVQNTGRIQGKIVSALQSRTALISASPAYNGGMYDLEKAAHAAMLTAPLLNEINGIDGLSSDRNFYDNDNDVNNADVFWRTDYRQRSSLEEMNFPPSLFGRGQVNPTQNFVDAFPMENGYPIDHPSSGYDSNYPYEERDPRLYETVVIHGSEVKGEIIDVSPQSATLDGLNLSIYSTRTGYYLKKLLRLDVNLDPSSPNARRHYFPLIRYTELFLNYAEAANEAWGPDGDPNGYGYTARDIIGVIRSRAGISDSDNYLEEVDSKETMRALIRNERRLELSFEGHRFWDIRRWRSEVVSETAFGVSVENGKYHVIEVENRRYILPRSFYGPIPQEEILKNDLLIQNEGW